MSDPNNKHYARDFIYTCPSKVFDDPTLTLNELKIYMMIRSFMDTTGSAYPSNAWLAARLTINKRNTINNINKLVNKGYLERIEENGQRYLTIPRVKIPLEGVSQKTSPHVVEDTPPHVVEDTQLYQSNIITKDIKERGKTTRTSVPDNFAPNENHKEFASQNNIDLKNETMAFVDYYKAHGKSMVNWSSAFSNWLRKSVSFGKNKNTKEHPVTSSIREFKEVMGSKEFMALLN